ncbi:MAG: hypothetical protein ABIH34_07095 [Nanoarchaeota archaeon]
MGDINPIIVAKDLNHKLVTDFHRYLKEHFPGLDVDLSTYDAIGSPLNKVIFAEHFVPSDECRDYAILMAMESNRVFFLDEGVGFSQSSFNPNRAPISIALDYRRLEGLVFVSLDTFDAFTAHESGTAKWVLRNYEPFSSFAKGTLPTV